MWTAGYAPLSEILGYAPASCSIARNGRMHDYKCCAVFSFILETLRKTETPSSDEEDDYTEIIDDDDTEEIDDSSKKHISKSKLTRV